jgi:hypothetical protein
MQTPSPQTPSLQEVKVQPSPHLINLCLQQLAPIKTETPHHAIHLTPSEIDFFNQAFAKETLFHAKVPVQEPQAVKTIWNRFSQAVFEADCLSYETQSLEIQNLGNVPSFSSQAWKDFFQQLPHNLEAQQVILNFLSQKLVFVGTSVECLDTFSTILKQKWIEHLTLPPPESFRGTNLVPLPGKGHLIWSLEPQIFQRIKETFSLAPHRYVLFGTGVFMGILGQQIKQAGFSVLHLGSLLDQLFSQLGCYQSKNTQFQWGANKTLQKIFCPQGYNPHFSQYLPENQTGQPIPYPYDFLHNQGEGMFVMPREDAMTVMAPYLELDPEQGDQRILSKLSQSEPFSLIRIGDAEACFLSIPKVLPHQKKWMHQYQIQCAGIAPHSFDPDSIEGKDLIAEFVTLLQQADIVMCHHPDWFHVGLNMWGKAFTALFVNKLFTQPKRYLDVHSIYRLTASGQLFQAMKCKRIVWVGAKADVIVTHFFNHPHYQGSFPFLGLEDITFLPSIVTPDIEDPAMLHRTDISNQVRERYALKPDIFIFSVGLLSKYLAHQVKEDGYIGLDLGNTLDSMVNFPNRRIFMNRFHTYHHPGFEFTFQGPWQVLDKKIPKPFTPKTPPLEPHQREFIQNNILECFTHQQKKPIESILLVTSRPLTWIREFYPKITSLLPWLLEESPPELTILTWESQDSEENKRVQDFLNTSSPDLPFVLWPFDPNHPSYSESRSEGFPHTFSAVLCFDCLGDCQNPGETLRWLYHKTRSFLFFQVSTTSLESITLLPEGGLAFSPGWIINQIQKATIETQALSTQSIQPSISFTPLPEDADSTDPYPPKNKEPASKMLVQVEVKPPHLGDIELSSNTL